MDINPSFCILIYKESTNLSEDVNYYLELGTFVNEKIVSLKPFSSDDIKNFSSILNKENSDSSNESFNIINKHIVFKDKDKVAWYPDNIPSFLYYIDGKITHSQKLVLPKMLFVLSYRLNNISVYFMKEDLGINSTYYKPNLPNYVSYVCIGANKIKGINEYERLSSVEEIFFKSPFTQKLKNIHKWRKNQMTLKEILRLK